MEGIKKYLLVNELRPGMVIAEKIISDGVVLASPGVIITDAIINKLKEKYFFDKVAVFGKKDVGGGKKKTIEDVEESFNEFSFNVHEIFDRIYSQNVPNMDEVRNFARRLQSEVDSTNLVVKNVVLYGSGKDSIYRHCVNVSALSFMLGKWIGFSENEINLLTYSAILHDFGKTKVDKNILDKAGSLTPKEFKEIKNHPIIGYNSVKEAQFLDPSVSYGVLMHHERMDGSGYPLGFKDEKIHVFAKIIAIADTFDAVNSDRIYRKRKGPFKALEIIQKEGLGKLDYEYCKIFIDHIINYYMGENVILSNNEICKIVQINVNDLSRPLLLGESGFIDLRQNKELVVERLAL